MEDIILVNLLKKKGIISESDIQEAKDSILNIISDKQEYPSSNVTSDIYENKTEYRAKETVSKMSHIEDNKRLVGEKFDIYKAKEICERYRGILSPSVTIYDIYVATNSYYHEYVRLYNMWFTDDVCQRIIEAAMTYWFINDKDSQRIKQLRQIYL